MNNILEKGFNPCSSCGVCAVVCPTYAISIKHSEDGFYRPILDENKCNNCGLCKNVCYKYIEPPKTFENFFKDKEIYGAWSKNENVVLNSSSGGVGHELISQALKDGYEVAGVTFDAETDTCKHKLANNISDAEKFRSSKYLQSYTVDAFSQFKADKKYLVVGTPCQIYGVRKYIQIKKWENNFILVDFFCHGTPTFLLWKKYKNYIQKKYRLRTFKDVNFRNKNKSSWHSYAMTILDVNNKVYHKDKAFRDDLFFKFFLSDTCLNKSCYQCLMRLDYCSSDIRLADFWGEKYETNKEGVTIISINSNIGRYIYNKIASRLNTDQCSFYDMNQSQPTRFHSTVKNINMMNLLSSSRSLERIYQSTIKPSFISTLKKNTKNLIKRLNLKK